MKLEIKHIAPYLPYGLKVRHNFKQVTYNGNKDLKDWDRVLEPSMLFPFVSKSELIFEYKPILRPLSDLTKPYKNDATYAEFVGIRHIINDEVESEHYYYDGSSRYVHIQHLTFSDFMILVENHFDVFGLIPNGLAIDINTIK